MSFPEDRRTALLPALLLVSFASDPPPKPPWYSPGQPWYGQNGVPVGGTAIFNDCMNTDPMEVTSDAIPVADGVGTFTHWSKEKEHLPYDLQYCNASNNFTCPLDTEQGPYTRAGKDELYNRATDKKRVYARVRISPVVGSQRPPGAPCAEDRLPTVVRHLVHHW